MRGVGEFLLVQRALAGVLDRQCGGDDQDVVEDIFLAGGEDHPRDAGVDGQAGHGPAELCQLVVLVDGA
ncbi:MAG TPA: hypothetical protein VF138_11160, partial [Caulobacteraceae bacterium]